LHCLTPQTIEGATPLNARMLRLPKDADIDALVNREDSGCFVQDIAASFPVIMLGNIAGKNVLEVGAAPGGKTAQLCAGGAHVTALDRSEARSERLRENMQRLGFDPEIRVRDMFEYEPTRIYDAVVLDAPCSATGTWRRHPEVLHLLEAGDVSELSVLQARMLERAWPWVKQGGTLLYCVCSLEQEEGEGQIDWFLKQHPDAKLRPVEPHALIHPEAIHASGYLRTLPTMLAEIGGMDGFFAVMFEKIA
jgi:16S rRNA (cytosine967-C5)-methyltransferase